MTKKQLFLIWLTLLVLAIIALILGTTTGHELAGGITALLLGLSAAFFAGWAA